MIASRRSRRVSPAISELTASGADLEIKRHPAARRLTLRISQTRRAVIVTIPMRCPLVEAHELLERNIDWVNERLGKLPDAVPFADQAVIPLYGAPHRIVFSNEQSTRLISRLVHQDDWPEIHVPGIAEQAPPRLNRWLIAEAKREIDKCVVKYARLIDVLPKRISVRDQSSRWGSCSTTGVLSFSWRLILAPPFVLDYVAAHEVAHMREMNHSRKFWNLLGSMNAQCESARQWLDVYGPDLHRYGTPVNA